MRHERARELLIDAVVGQLDAAQQEELQRHLEGCESCAAEAALQEPLRAGLGLALVPGPAADGLERLRAAVRDELNAITDGPAGDASVGVAGPSTPGRWSPLARACAAAALIVLGVLVGLGLDAGRRPVGPAASVDAAAGRYLVLIHATTEPPEQSDQVTAEMQAWIGELTRNGTLESLQGAGDGGPTWLGAGPDPGAARAAFFVVIRADTLAHARQIAATSPSLAYGGAIDVRAIDEQGRR